MSLTKEGLAVLSAGTHASDHLATAEPGPRVTAIGCEYHAPGPALDSRKGDPHSPPRPETGRRRADYCDKRGP